MDSSLPPPPMPPSYQSFEDANHLKMLSIAHYIFGGITAFFSCFALFYILMGGVMLSGKLPMHPSPPAPSATAPPSTGTAPAPSFTGTPSSYSSTPPAVTPPPPVSGHPERWMGAFFVGFGLLFLAFGMGLATCLFLTGRWLAARKRPTFCLVVACIQCINMPLGTILGVFTIMVLNRPSVRALFAAGPEHNNFVRH